VENRFPMALDTVRNISNRYYNILSSLTLRGLEAIRKIINEAIMLKGIIRDYIKDRRAYIKKRYN
jgi:hypothetical protein